MSQGGLMSDPWPNQQPVVDPLEVLDPDSAPEVTDNDLDEED